MNGHAKEDESPRKKSRRKRGTVSTANQCDVNHLVSDASTSPCSTRQQTHSKSSSAIARKHQHDDGHDIDTCRRQLERRSISTSVLTQKHHYRADHDINSPVLSDTASLPSRRHRHKTSSAPTQKDQYDDNHNVNSPVVSAASTPVTKRHRNKVSSDQYNDHDVKRAGATTTTSNPNSRHRNKSSSALTPKRHGSLDANTNSVDADSSRSPTSRRHRNKSGSKNASALSRKHKSYSDLNGFLHTAAFKETTRPLVDATSLAAGRRQDALSVTSSPALPSKSLRNVVYYQNRFIVLDSPASKPSAHSSTGNLSADGHSRRSKRTGRRAPRSRDGAAETVADDKFDDRGKRELCQADDQKLSRGDKQNMDMDATSVTMDSRGIVPEIVVSDTDGIRYSTQIKQKSVVKRITGILIDNRMKGRRDCEVVLRDHPEQYRVLKKVLNIVIVTIGFALLLSVCIVIAYTAIVPSKSEPSTNTEDTVQETNTPKVDTMNETSSAENWANRF